MVSPPQGSAVTEPQPAPAHTAIPQPSGPNLRGEADAAFRVRDFKRALELYEVLAQANDAHSYNDVAKSKHGAALWRVAELGPEADRVAQIDHAIGLLTQALSHRDPGYRARSFYERSKAWWHRWRTEPSDRALQQAVADAGEAARIEGDPSFINWYERLTAEEERLRTTGQRPGGSTSA